jgi:hypothetical protein
MKTSLDLPEDLYRSVKVKAAQEGRTISDIVSEGIRLVLCAPAARPPRRVRFPLIAGRPNQHLLKQKHVDAAEVDILAEEAARVGVPKRR